MFPASSDLKIYQESIMTLDIETCTQKNTFTYEPDTLSFFIHAYVLIRTGSSASFNCCDLSH